MNCKPGDLAILVAGECPEYYGEIYKVLRPYDGPAFPGASDPQWWVDAYGEECHCEDCYLRPIRDPGDEAKDETLLWKPVPKSDELSKEDAELLIDALREWAKE